MAKGMTVKIDMDPMYIDYINNKYEVYRTKNNKIFASSRTEIGKLIKSLIITPPQNQTIKAIQDPFLEFVLPDYTDVNTLYRHYLSENSKKIIRKFIRKDFYFELHSHLNELHHAGINEIKAGILTFCEIHDINEDHFNFDTLKKEYYRYRSKKKAKKTGKISSVFMAVLSLLCPFVSPGILILL